MFLMRRNELLFSFPSPSPPPPLLSLTQLSILQEQPRRDAIDTTPSSTSSSSTLFPIPGAPSDSSVSCPGTPSAQHSKLGVGCPSPGATMKRPTGLSRHASAAGFPIHSWVFTKGQGKGAITPNTPQDSSESMAIEVEDIPSLLSNVARFAEAVEKLKDVVLGEDKQENRRPLAHECLGEVLRVLRQVISTYPLLNTVETLTAAGKLISKVKGFHYETCNDAEKKDFEKAIETIAVAFSSSVSELLMGEVDSSTLLSLLPTEKSRSMENLYGVSGQGLEGAQMRGDLQDFGRAEEVDIMLQHSEGGVDSALAYAKTISKYMKDLMSYVEKRTSLEAPVMTMLFPLSPPPISQPHMPFYSIYSLALEQDLEQSSGMQQATSTLHNQTFLQPLMQRKHEHEKKRKEVKEQWYRAKRKLMECESNLRKAKHAYMARCEEHDKAKAAASRAAEEDGGGSTTKSLGKKLRVEEDARNKAEEAEATYRTCIADATTQQQELEHVKVNVLRLLQEVIKQSDQTLRSATISYYQIMHMQTVVLPVHYQTLCESSKLYDPGQQYAAHVRDLQLTEEPEVTYQFEPYTATAASTQHPARPLNDSFNTDQQSSSEGQPSTGETTTGEDLIKTKQCHKSWGSTVSDADSVEGEGALESPTTSSGDISKMARTSSTGTMSSNEDPDEKDGNVASFEAPNINGMEPEIAVPTGPFRNIGLSKAAQTHRLRKLRTPSKCRECDSYVYFQGLITSVLLSIQCGHKKLQGRLQLFGRDFSQVSSGSSDSIPFIITKCISEIERRALKTKGIYRVNGVKTRVEKLCQAFENGKELVELSQCSPHDISNVLKLYLRQLPEPIMPFRLYNSLMGLAKESLQTEGGEAGTGKGPELVDLGPDTDPAVLAVVDRLRELVKELPKANVATLRYIVRHLRRIAELEQDNKMSPSNLGIVFGPSLIRPRPTGATVSLSSLVDYPHQARIIETLIVFYTAIFQSKSSSTSSRPSSISIQQVCSFPGSLSSSEQIVDSDSELDETGRGSTHRPHCLVKQESEVSTEDDQLNCRDSLELSSQSVPQTDPDPDQDQESPGPDASDHDPPEPPDSEPPDLEVSEQELSISLAELNMNQSNNYVLGHVWSESQFGAEGQGARVCVNTTCAMCQPH
uniref:Rho GTPase activating protein 45 n=1 Tax=Salmo trutta TaxID=8032 RepID=A0A674DMT6_SALTR